MSLANLMVRVPRRTSCVTASEMALTICAGVASAMDAPVLARTLLERYI